MSELKRDVVFGRIPSERYQELIDFGWETGESAARSLAARLKTTLPSEMAQKLNLSILSEDWEEGRSSVKVYSEYEDRFGRITLHPNIIREGLERLNKKGFCFVENYEAARELFLAHEIFHFMECRELGLTSRKKEIVTLKIGRLKICSGVRALGEIAAHAFTRVLIGVNVG